MGGIVVTPTPSDPRFSGVLLAATHGVGKQCGAATGSGRLLVGRALKVAAPPARCSVARPPRGWSTRALPPSTHAPYGRAAVRALLLQLTAARTALTGERQGHRERIAEAG